MMVFAIPGPDDSNNKKCRSKDYICNILRGTIMFSKFKADVFMPEFSGSFWSCNYWLLSIMSSLLLHKKALKLHSFVVCTSLGNQPLCPEQFLFSTLFSHLWVSSFLITQVKQLAEKARAGKLAPNEFQGGTFRQGTYAYLPFFFREFCPSLKFHMLTF